MVFLFEIMNFLNELAFNLWNLTWQPVFVLWLQMLMVSAMLCACRSKYVQDLRNSCQLIIQEDLKRLRYDEIFNLTSSLPTPTPHPPDLLQAQQLPARYLEDAHKDFYLRYSASFRPHCTVLTSRVALRWQCGNWSLLVPPPPPQSGSALTGTNGNLPKKRKTVKYHHTLPRLPESPLQQNNLLRSSCERESGVMHDGGAGRMGGGWGGGHWLSSHMGGERKKTAFHSNLSQSASLSSLPSLRSSSPSPSTSPSLASWICNDRAAQPGRVWRRLVSSAGTAPLHPRQKQTSLQQAADFRLDGLGHFAAFTPRFDSLGIKCQLI